ncbi:unnamed protein product [Linum tenue]|uniref:Uncharacterized protein n=1 Tax=Linum tenue TaxID=586396 RepID=A0AAV0J942_9ROSI|nr:unnamed protein product [Linum tenue]
MPPLTIPLPLHTAAGKKLHFVLVIDIQERQIPSTTKVQVFINIHREMGWAPCCDQTNVKKGPMPPEEHAKQKEHMGYASDLFYLLKSSLRGELLDDFLSTRVGL